MRGIWRRLLVCVCLTLGIGAGVARAQEKEAIAAPAGEPIIINEAAPLSGWYVQLDAIILHRSVGSSAALVTDPTGTKVLRSAGDFNFNWDAGPRIVLGRQLDDSADFELVYFGLYHMNASSTLAQPGIPVGTTLVGTNHRGDYSSSMENVEASLRLWLNGELSILAGFRYLNWHEDFTGSSYVHAAAAAVAIGATESRTILTNNNLFGAQIGAEWQRAVTDRLGVDVYGKTGIFGNEAFQRTNANTVEVYRGGGLGVEAAPTASCGHAQAAFVGELGFVGTYRLTDRITLRGGYTLMWIQGIALAPDQIGYTKNAVGAALPDVSSHGGVFLHGAIAGAELRW